MITLIARKSKMMVHLVSLASSIIAASLIIFIATSTVLHSVRWNWLNFGSQKVDLIFEYTSGTIPLSILVSITSLLVTIYSIGFFKWDNNQPRYYSTLSFFTFSMLGLTLSGNLLQTFVFWELVGLSSYLLIGFYRTKPEAASASTKAFVMNKIGDAGFIIALMVLYSQYGSLGIS
jgi:NADH-quinone oxidoreductase subunit L